MNALGSFFSFNNLFLPLVVLVGAASVIWLLSRLYMVVPAHQAHVVVTRGSGRKVYCSRPGYKSSYWSIRLFQRRSIIPLEIVKLTIGNIPLRDKNIAKFKCDVVAWLIIEILRRRPSGLDTLILEDGTKASKASKPTCQTSYRP